MPIDCWRTAARTGAGARPKSSRRDAKPRSTSGGRAGYDRTCRDRTAPPSDRTSYVVRFKTPLDGEIVIDDLVKGRIVFQNAEIDDFVILRSDGSADLQFLRRRRRRGHAHHAT